MGRHDKKRHLNITRNKLIFLFSIIAIIIIGGFIFNYYSNKNNNVKNNNATSFLDTKSKDKKLIL